MRAMADDPKGKRPATEGLPKKKIRSAQDLLTDIYKARPTVRLGRKEDHQKRTATKEVQPLRAVKVVDLIEAADAKVQGESVPTAKSGSEKKVGAAVLAPELGLKDTDSVFKSTRVARIMLTKNRLPEDVAFTSSLETTELLKRIFLASSQGSNLMAEICQRVANVMMELKEKEELESSLRAL